MIIQIYKLKIIINHFVFKCFQSISLSIGNSPNSNASTTHIILHSSPSANTTTEQHRTPTRNNVNDIAHTDNNEIITTALSSNDRGNPPTYEEAVNPDGKNFLFSKYSMQLCT